jgi:uncharacterized caspase-like protein
MAALVFGNSAYQGCNALNNPVNDARDTAAKLTSYGFHVILSTDATRVEMDRKLREFREQLKTNDVGMFFFAGHGMQIEGTNYLLAVDTDTSSELDAKHSSLLLDKVIDTMAKSDASTKIVILDACRNNPWERAWHRSPAMRGLASVYAPKGTIIGFATSPGEVAEDGSGRNGTYTGRCFSTSTRRTARSKQCSSEYATLSRQQHAASRHRGNIPRCQASSTLI